MIKDQLTCGRPGCACRRGARVHCPNVAGHKHGDAEPSLSVTETTGKVLVHCHGGCSQDEVIAALKDRGLWETSPEPVTRGRDRLVASYPYKNRSGEVVAVHGRFEGDGRKSFAWCRPDGDWRDGLAGLAISSLPLYRVTDLDLAPDEPVWFCEGEKAVEACVSKGLLAVCAGGGAAQQQFGNSLDPLLAREVILWPDNDEPGQALMGRIHALLPHSRYVRPVVPPKGDAYDYFAAGGTVEALQEMTREAQPSVSVYTSDALVVSMPVAEGKVDFWFTELASARRSVEASVRITASAPGVRRTPFDSRLNLQSSSGRDGLRRELESVYGKTGLPWPQLIAEACSLGIETWRGMDTSVDLADVALPEKREWAVDLFAPKDVVTIVFGMGGSGKSYLTADLALCCLYGNPWLSRPTQEVKGVLVLDYEDQPEEWRLRVQQLADGHGWPFPTTGYRYMRGNAIPLADQIARIRQLVEEWEIGLIIVDSAVSACGGDMKDEQAPARMFNALTALGITTIVIAHNTKAEDSNYPYGSIFWHNLARATHYVETSQDEGSNVITGAVWNRKGNRGKQRPIPVQILFPQQDSGAVMVEILNDLPQGLPSMSTEPSGIRWSVMELLMHEGPMTTREIHETTGIEMAQLRTMFSRHKDSFTTLADGRRAVLSERKDV